MIAQAMQSRLTAVSIILLSFCAQHVARGQSIWNVAGGGDWNSPANWIGGVPNAVGAGAVFGPSLPTSRATINVSSPVTVGSIEINAQDNLTKSAAISAGRALGLTW